MSAATTLSLPTGTQACTLCAHPAPGLSPRPRGPLADLLCACQDCRGKCLTRPSPAQGRLQGPAEAPRPGSRHSTSGLTDSSGPLFALFHFRKLPSRSSSLLERVLSAGPGSVKAGEMTAPCVKEPLTVPRDAHVVSPALQRVKEHTRRDTGSVTHELCRAPGQGLPRGGGSPQGQSSQGGGPTSNLLVPSHSWPQAGTP